MSRKDKNDTRQRLAQITDAGHFEKLATAVLREEDAHCRRLAHVGVNVEGKTVKSPVDGIVYTSVDGQLHMLAVHHNNMSHRRPSEKVAYRSRQRSPQDPG